VALSQIFDKPENFSVESVSKIKQQKTQSNKDKIVFDCLIRTLIDKNRHGLDIIDWTIDKNPNVGLTREDFKNIMDMKLSDIIEIME
jgi:hypothetical protein